MPGREKISARKIHNLGLGKLEKACDEIVDKHMSKKHMLSLLKGDEEAMHHLANMTLQEFKDHMLGVLRLNASKMNHRLAQVIDEIPNRHLPQALSLILTKITDLEGEPTQRVEVTKKGLTNEQWDKLLEKLPTKPIVEVENIDADPV